MHLHITFSLLSTVIFKILNYELYYISQSTNCLCILSYHQISLSLSLSLSLSVTHCAILCFLFIITIYFCFYYFCEFCILYNIFPIFLLLTFLFLKSLLQNNNKCF